MYSFRDIGVCVYVTLHYAEILLQMEDFYKHVILFCFLSLVQAKTMHQESFILKHDSKIRQACNYMY